MKLAEDSTGYMGILESITIGSLRVIHFTFHLNAIKSYHNLFCFENISEGETGPNPCLTYTTINTTACVRKAGTGANFAFTNTLEAKQIMIAFYSIF